MMKQTQHVWTKKTDFLLLETAVQIRDLLEQLVAYKMEQERSMDDPLMTAEVALPVECPVAVPVLGRRVVHIRDLVLAEGDYLMDTVEALSQLGFSRGTLDSHRAQGLLTDVSIGKKGGGVRFIATEVMRLRELYSVRKGKV